MGLWLPEIISSEVVTVMVKAEMRVVNRIYFTRSALATAWEDGTVVTWGHKEYGGDSNQV